MDILETLDREGLRIAPDEKRILAFVIDDVIVSLVFFAAFYNQFASLNGDIEAIYNLLGEMTLYMSAIIIVYHSFFTAMYGASVGKIICKIKIIKIATIDKPNIFDSILRAILRLCSMYMFYIPMLIAFANPFRQSIYDYLLKTIVIDVSIPQEID